MVDDVISTGASTLAALNLVRKVDADPVVIGALVTEGSGWRTVLGPVGAMVRALGALRVFRPSDLGVVVDWG